MLDLPVIFHFHLLILCAFPILSIMSTCFFYNKAVDMWSFVDDENKKNFNTYNELIHFLIIRTFGCLLGC